MSLKSIHILFIVLSASLAVMFGVWSLRSYSTAVGAGSFVVAAALIAYGIWFLKKTKGIGRP